MRIVGIALFTLVSTSASAATINYDLLPGLHAGSETKSQEWQAEVLSRKDGKVYLCRAQVGQDSIKEKLSLTCMPNNRFKGTLLTGDNVITVPNTPFIPPAHDPSSGFDFWQLDRSTGLVQFCYMSAPPGTDSCVRYQIP